MRRILITIVIAAALGTALPQSATHDLRLSDIEAKQPSRESILDSDLCQRARETPHQLINQRTPIDPKTRLPDLNSLMEKSDDVVLALAIGSAAELVSPSGENPVTYVEAMVMRSWKGSHHAGDILTYGWPGGHIRCDPALVQIWPGGPGETGTLNYGDSAMVLFLRQSKDQKEAGLIEGLRATGGGGTQGVFPIDIPSPRADLSDACKFLPDDLGIANENVQHCASYMENNRSPILVSLTNDPLHKYNGMPAADFLREVTKSAAAAGTIATGP